MPETILAINGIDFPAGSGRGIKQTLEALTNSGSLRRTVNGELVDLSPPQFRKYKSTLTCEDQQTPTIDGLFPGDEILVDCIVELSYLTSGGSPQRTVVSGSSRTYGSYTFYRPQLTFKIVGLNIERDEWQAIVSWSVELEEV